MGGRILFVCTGNTCRSSMAEALARQWLQVHAPDQGVSVWSAGVAAVPGSPASIQAVQVMREKGIDLTGHRSRTIYEEVLAQSDLVLTMTSRHKKMLLVYYPKFADRIFTLSEYATGDRQGINGEVADPYGQAIPVYQECAGQLSCLIEQALQRFLQVEL